MSHFAERDEAELKELSYIPKVYYLKDREFTQ